MPELQSRLDQVAAYLREDRYHDAMKLALEVLEESPKNPQALFLLGHLAFRLQQPDQALQWLEHALLADPRLGAAWLLRARVLRMLRRPQEALASAEKASACDPRSAEAWHTSGFLKMALGLWSEARIDLAQAVTLNPGNPVVRSQYALALCETNDLEAAFREVQDALRQSPGHPEILMTKADILDAAGYFDLAAQYRPKDAVVTFNQAAAVFTMGDCARGLALIAARSEALAPSGLNLPAWDGREDFGLHLLLSGEQGFGDMIHFLRYVPLLKQRVGKVSLRVPRPLVDLLRFSMPSLSVLEMNTGASEGEALPVDLGAHSRLMALPQHLCPSFDFRGGTVPYLKADEAKRAFWREKLAGLPRPLVGLVWSGNPKHTTDHRRSFAFAKWKPVLALGASHFVAMQVGGETPEGVFDAAPFIKNFADTAALLAELDLLISVDSAPAHTAGALGRPVWTLLSFTPDWRWLLGREDTPWYPSMRLIRQKQPGDWDRVLADATELLRALFAGDRSVLTPPAWQGPVLKRHPDALPLPGIERESGF